MIFVNRSGSLALRGALALLFGFTALLWPGQTMAVLVLMSSLLLHALRIRRCDRGVDTRDPRHET